MSAAIQEEGQMRDGAARSLVFAFAASLLLHAAVFVVLPRIEELSAPVPPEPVPLIARVVRPEPPEPPQEERASSDLAQERRPAPQKPPPVARPAPSSEPASARSPAPAQTPALALPQPEPAPAPTPRSAPIIVATRPAPAVPEIDARAVDDFRQGVIVQAARYKRYPRVAIDNGWQGEVLVRMRIGPDGRIAALRVARGSGHEVLDRQALQMFRRAKPLVAIPGALRGRAFELDLRAVYNLRDQRSG
jgi:protein TonB